jgi:hypothetical protein
VRVLEQYETGAAPARTDLDSSSPSGQNPLDQLLVPEVQPRPISLGPLGQDGGDRAGLVGNQCPLGESVAALLALAGDQVARAVGALAPPAGIGDGEDG